MQLEKNGCVLASAQVKYADNVQSLRQSAVQASQNIVQQLHKRAEFKQSVLSKMASAFVQVKDLDPDYVSLQQDLAFVQKTIKAYQQKDNNWLLWLNRFVFMQKKVLTQKAKLKQTLQGYKAVDVADIDPKRKKVRLEFAKLARLWHADCVERNVEQNKGLMMSCNMRLDAVYSFMNKHNIPWIELSLRKINARDLRDQIQQGLLKKKKITRQLTVLMEQKRQCQAAKSAIVKQICQQKQEESMKKVRQWQYDMKQFISALLLWPQVELELRNWPKLLRQVHDSLSSLLSVGMGIPDEEYFWSVWADRFNNY